MKLSHLLPLGFFSLAPIAACGGATIDDLPGTGGAAGAGGGSAGTASAGQSGAAGASGAAGGGNQCTSAAQCVVPAGCQMCPNGTMSCPTATCVDGKCGLAYPGCKDSMCKTSLDCPQTDGPCAQCPDGTVACPNNECVSGQCVQSFGTCPATPCAPQNADGVGACDAFFGVKWDGKGCVSVGGCSCQGADCKNLYKSPDACKAAHAGCSTGSPCAGKQCGDVCTNCQPGQACPPFVESCDQNGQCGGGTPSCGGTSDPCDQKGCGEPCKTQCDAPGCVPQPGACNAAGVCSVGTPLCQNADCKPMNAAGVGACAAFFGYAWNGAQCVGLGGCSCQGSDCKNLYPGLDECLNARAACACDKKQCGDSCTCPGGACTKGFYYCDHSGSCKTTPPVCPF